MPLITLFFASLLVLLNLVLMVRVTLRRRERRIGLGSGGDALLQQRIRAHANFIEQAPLALLLMMMLELSALAPVAIWVLGALLLAGRVLHAIGVSGSGGYSFGRFTGTLLSWAVLLASAVLGLYVVAMRLF
ncbi:MAPEG family protein [Marilutibacter spongiae]|uniref:MAPEG family protein n=1 Tax=Marilutibacter spongiae TaxID=2025720 RepID=A0A7W3Y6E4_9GAMM|nr:MAPEG family protein [Lysobacter spongiae]MBB1061034.1 MAPEG family protein [Lysobacter spongiae]